MAWKPPRKPTDLRGVHVVELDHSEKKEAEYFSLIVSRGLSLTPKVDYNRQNYSKVDTQKSPQKTSSKTEQPVKPAVQFASEAFSKEIKPKSNPVRNTVIISSIIGITAGGYGLSQLIFGTGNRQPAKKIEEPSTLAVPTESRPVVDLEKERTRQKPRDEATAEPEETLGKGKNRVFRNNGGVSTNNRSEAQPPQPVDDNRDRENSNSKESFNVPPITEVAPATYSVEGTVSPPGAEPAPPQPPPGGQPTSFVPDQQPQPNPDPNAQPPQNTF